MPKLLVHLWIADKMAGRYPMLKDPDYYLGCIAPDAVYSRNKDVMLNKVVSHIMSSVRYWEKNVMLSFKQIPKPTLFELGYYMHIITDIRFRLIMKQYYDNNKVSKGKRAYYDSLIIPLCLRRLFYDEQEYMNCLSFTKLYKVDKFPFTITKADIENNFEYAENIFNIKKVSIEEEALDIPLPDYKAMCDEVIVYLQKQFHLQLSTI
jgi:hypothetical protein